MSEKKNIFPQEIELSEIVLKKANLAFEQIRQEDTDKMKKEKGKKSFKVQAAAIAGICVLAAGSISAVSAIRHYWGRGMNGNIQATDSEQQTLTENGIADVYSEKTDYEALAVTENGITIAPETVVVDERIAYLSFKISGYDFEEGTEPGFETVDVYQGDSKEAEDSALITSGGMYDGVVSDENGTPVYEDGSMLESTEDGSIISHYTDADGNLEYIMQASVAEENASLLGQTIHVNFKNLGTLSQAEFLEGAIGEWDFTIKLPDVSVATEFQVGQSIEGTGFVMDSVSISPVSMKVNYSVNEAQQIKDDDLHIPEVKGIVLKDGTRLPYLIDGSSIGYTDDTMKKAYQIAGYDRVIDVDEVAALIVLNPDDNTRAEIPVLK